MKFFTLSFLASLFFFFQDTSAATQEYNMNDIRVIICDDFLLPIAKVGVIYSIGLDQFKNICEAEIIEKSFLSETTKRVAKNFGTDIDFNIYDSFSEATAIVSSEEVSDIVKIILDNKPSIKNLQSIKSKVKIKHKLSDYFETNLINDEIYACTDSRYIFSESILDNLTEKDLKISLQNKYAKANISIIICGRFNTEKLIEKLNLKQTLPVEIIRDAGANNSVKSENANDSVINLADEKEEIAKTEITYDLPKRIIEARSKFFGRSLYYAYHLGNPKFAEKRNVIFSILNYEIFNHLKKYSQLIDDFFITNSHKSDLFLMGFKLKRDISKKSFEIGLKDFLSRLKKVEFSRKKSELISKLEKFSEIDIDENIHAKYRMIRNRHILRLQTQKNTSEEILKISSDDIRNFTKLILENNLIAKISTQYKTGN